MPAPASNGGKFLEVLDQELKNLRSRLLQAYASPENHEVYSRISSEQLTELERQAPLVFSEIDMLAQRLSQHSFGGPLYAASAGESPHSRGLVVSPQIWPVTSRQVSTPDCRSRPGSPEAPSTPRDMMPTPDGNFVRRPGPRLKGLETSQPDYALPDDASDLNAIPHQALSRAGSRVLSRAGSGFMSNGENGSRAGSDCSYHSKYTCRTSTQTPLGRWRHLCLSILMPDRAQLFRKFYSVQPCWASYLVMLRKNSSDCRKEYTAALAKISSCRKGQYRKSREKSGMTTLMSMMAPGFMTTHPHSPKRMAWVFLSFVFLLCDAFMLPIGAFFEPGYDEIFEIYMLLGILFWTLDIAVSFMTGRYVYGILEMRPRRIARAYIRTWLFFDVFMVLLDVALFVIDVTTDKTSVTSFGAAFKSVRVIRLVRLLRLGKLQVVLREALAINNKGVIVFAGIIKTTLVYIIYLNFLACVWYGIGQSEENGWTSECQSQAHCYFAAAHWALTQLHGTSNLRYQTTLEVAFATLSLFFGLLLFAYFLGRSAHAVAHFIASDKLKMRQTWSSYTKNHRLSNTLAHRVLRYIDACDLQVDLGQQLQRERDMLQNFAYSLRAEILEAARKPLLTRITIIADMSFVSARILTNLCAEASTSLFCLCGEVVFAMGEVGSHWRMLESGVLVYLNGQEKRSDFKDCMTAFLSDNSGIGNASPQIGRGILELQSKHTNFGNLKALEVAKCESFEVVMSHAASGHKAEAVVPGQGISEMVLWTSWIHSGELLATSDSVLLQLSLDAFYSVLKARTASCLLAAAYAHKYVKHLSAMEDGVSDLLAYIDVDDEELDFTYLSETQEHVIFLSHYKAEAGTEATLLRESLQLFLDDGVGFGEFAVFLDSEDLADLADLKLHVMNSRNLVLLLTPGVISRPWCLIEIFTAFYHGVNIVPVDIQRPGLYYSYPDEEYYRKLRSGDLFSPTDKKLFILDDVSFEDLENALRFVFMQIALPYSPHKSKGVRDAELHDIIRRCLPGFTPVAYQSAAKTRRPSVSSGTDNHINIYGSSNKQPSSGSIIPQSGVAQVAPERESDREIISSIRSPLSS